MINLSHEEERGGENSSRLRSRVATRHRETHKHGMKTSATRVKTSHPLVDMAWRDIPALVRRSCLEIIVSWGGGGGRLRQDALFTPPSAALIPAPRGWTLRSVLCTGQEETGGPVEASAEAGPGQGGSKRLWSAFVATELA